MDSNIQTLRNNFSHAYRQQDYLSAIIVGERLLRYHHLTSSVTHPGYSDDVFNLACAYDQIHAFDRSVALYTECIKLMAPKGETLTYSNCLCNLAAAYSHKGDYDTALACHSQVFEIRKKYLRPNHKDYIFALYNLANAHGDCKEFDYAIPLLKKALRLLKDKDMDYADVLSSLCFLYENIGDFSTAIKYMQKASTILRKLEGNTDDELMQNTYYLAQLHEKNKEPDKALRYYNKAAAMIQRRLGETHPFYAAALNHMSNIYCKQDNYKKGIALKMKILNAMKKTVGDSHISYINSLKAISQLQTSIASHKEARETFGLSLPITRKLFGETSREYLADLMYMCSLYLDEGNYQQALDLLVHIIRQRDNLNEEQRKYIDQLADIYDNIGDRLELLDHLKDFQQTNSIFDVDSDGVEKGTDQN